MVRHTSSRVRVSRRAPAASRSRQSAWPRLAHSVTDLATSVPRRLGVVFHVGGHVGQDDPIGQALQIGAQAAQFFLGDPQGWRGPTFPHPDGPEALAAQARAADVDIYIHAPYVINVATSNNRIRIPSRKILGQQIAAATRIGARGLIVHGGHVMKDDDPQIGYDNWRKAVDQIEFTCPVFIENTAGGQNAMARRLDDVARLWDAVGHSGVGFCIDTCHAWAAGLELPAAIAEFRAITGRIDLVHANDSAGDFDSGRDRHRNLGDGTIGRERVLESCQAAKAPIICETPAPGIVADISAIREFLAG